MSKEIIFFFSFFFHFLHFGFHYNQIMSSEPKQEDFSRNISIEVLIKYLQWLGCKCHFSVLPIINVWKLQVAIATKLKS